MHIQSFRRHDPAIITAAGHAVLANFDIAITEGLVKDAGLVRYADTGTLMVWSPRARNIGSPAIIFSPAARAALLEEAAFLYGLDAPQLEAAA